MEALAAVHHSLFFAEWSCAPKWPVALAVEALGPTDDHRTTQTQLSMSMSTSSSLRHSEAVEAYYAQVEVPSGNIVVPKICLGSTPV